MKINNVNRVNLNPYQKQLEKLEKTEKTSKRDKLEISTEALEMQKGSPIEIERQKKVEELKQKVESGQYEINPKKTAESLYSFWNDTF